MDSALEQLAAAHGVATWYRDAKRRRVDVDPDVVRRVLGLLGVSADNPAQVRDELAAARAPKTPGTVVLRQGQRCDLREPGVLTDEDGTERPVTKAIPPDLAPGWYSLTSGEQHSTILVAPPALPEPARTWGWMLQLYA
ncbi:MAG: 4-alpha-glucanotransferase, partial [Pseudonocardiales bacterium]|nr:4-alpha-glucanotransferase [Pseudonocardiales bacterium]